MLPNDYLGFAIADFTDGSKRGLVNAFGNAKRALHFQIDILLHQYGLFKHFGKSNFPTKLQLLDDIGILPINIMRNLNVERNLIEHEYDTPSNSRVAEAIDVVKLLLLASEKLLEMTPYEAVVGWKEPRRQLVLRLEPLQGEINLFTLRAKGKYKKINGVSCFVGPLRDFSGNQIMPGINIPKTPWRLITLNKAEASSWKPIIAELVNTNRQRSMHKTFVHTESAAITIPITVPLPEFENKPWSQIMDEFLHKQRREMDMPQEAIEGEADQLESESEQGGDPEFPA